MRLRATKTLAELLNHVYVLLPVADNHKHYWIGEAEVDKLLAHGAGGLEEHPRKDLIVRRYIHRAPAHARRPTPLRAWPSITDPRHDHPGPPARHVLSYPTIPPRSRYGRKPDRRPGATRPADHVAVDGVTWITSANSATVLRSIRLSTSRLARSLGSVQAGSTRSTARLHMEMHTAITAMPSLDRFAQQNRTLRTTSGVRTERGGRRVKYLFAMTYGHLPAVVYSFMHNFRLD